jgi:hypothetical protein
VVIGNRIMKFFIIISTIILIDLIYFEIAKPADNARIIIDENLRLGMPLKDAINLLGPPERIQISKIGTIVLPYDTLGLSIEVMSDETIIEGIHLQSSFKGQFASGLEIGVDFQKILSVYNQPDMMTKGTIEYYDIARIFQIDQGRLIGADLYSEKSTLYRQVSSKETGKYGEKETGKYGEKEAGKYGEKEAGKYEEKETGGYEEKEAGKYEEKETGNDEEVDVFELFGFKVKNTYQGVIITEIRPVSVAEYGGLKVGERVRKASLEGYGVRNIYTVSGVENILKKAIERGKKTVNILQDKNYYYIVEVPRRK